MRYAHPNGDYLNIEKHEKDETKRCASRRNLSKIFWKSIKNLWRRGVMEVFRFFRCSLTYLMRFAQNRRTKQAQSQTRLSFALQGGGRRKSNLSKIYADAKGIKKNRVFRVFRCSLTYLMRFAQKSNKIFWKSIKNLWRRGVVGEFVFFVSSDVYNIALKDFLRFSFRFSKDLTSSSSFAPRSFKQVWGLSVWRRFLLEEQSIDYMMHWLKLSASMVGLSRIREFVFFDVIKLFLICLFGLREAPEHLRSARTFTS